MKSLSITEMQSIDGPILDSHYFVAFSDGREYEVEISDCSNGFDCTLRMLSSQRTVTSLLRRRMVLEHLGLESAVTRLEKSHAGNLRRSLRKYGYKLRKSHASKYPHEYNQGGYLVTSCGGVTMLGPCFSATLEQVEEFLAARAAEFKADGLK